jgi:hypothetical protein
MKRSVEGRGKKALGRAFFVNQIAPLEISRLADVSQRESSRGMKTSATLPVAFQKSLPNVPLGWHCYWGSGKSHQVELEKIENWGHTHRRRLLVKNTLSQQQLLLLWDRLLLNGTALLFMNLKWLGQSVSRT